MGYCIKRYTEKIKFSTYYIDIFNKKIQIVFIFIILLFVQLHSV